MRLNITEGEMYYTNELDAIQDTIKRNFPNFDVRIARGKYPFVSVKVTKNVNNNIKHRLSDLFAIRQEDDGRITCTCSTYDNAEFFDLTGIVNYFNDYLNDPNTENNRGYFESIKRRMNESAYSESEIKRNIDRITSSGGDAYDAMDYLESIGFIDAGSTDLKYPNDNAEITTFYNDTNSDMYVAIDHTPLYKGNEVIKVWFGRNKSVKRQESFRRKRTHNTRMKENYYTTDTDYLHDIAEEAAHILKDMDWKDTVYASYGSYDESWNAFVADVEEQLYSDPQTVIDALEDDDEEYIDRGLIRKITKYFM